MCFCTCFCLCVCFAAWENKTSLYPPRVSLSDVPVAGCCRGSQGVAGCCRVLQGVAVCVCSTSWENKTFFCPPDCSWSDLSVDVMQCVAMCCRVLQCDAVECSGLQWVAVGCSGLHIHPYTYLGIGATDGGDGTRNNYNCHKFSQQSPFTSNTVSRESPKFQTSLHVSEWSPRNSKDLPRNQVQLAIQIF